MSSCRSAQYKNAIQALKRCGLKLTKQREAVVDAFCQNSKPLSHKMIYQHILEKGEGRRTLPLFTARSRCLRRIISFMRFKVGGLTMPVQRMRDPGTPAYLLYQL
ncbi:MAG: hypothetical protein HRU09_14900 [Oligoflexales bacterium]|nr:hypothetical protein [Oligoflexales bacterium]